MRNAQRQQSSILVEDAESVFHALQAIEREEKAVDARIAALRRAQPQVEGRGMARRRAH